MLWDIFCRVIDNHGDLGVCWRLCADLAARGERARLWVDEPAALAWMAPQGLAGVEVVHWTAGSPAAEPGEVVVEAFGCDPHEAFVAAVAAKARREGRQPAWINLEYLSAEPWVERCHGLASPVMSGPAKGLTKRFFYPGFTPRTGGLLREPGLPARQRAFDPAAFLGALGLPAGAERRVSLFCYEPPALPALLRQLGEAGLAGGPVRLLVTPGRARAAVDAALAALGDAPRPAISHLPALPQPAFDELLWSCDLNLVRGEDSLVRALWAGRAFAWHIYPQDDDAHHAKLEAFLGWLQAPPSLRAFHQAWNGTAAATLPPIDLPGWTAAAVAARERLLAQDDLLTQLLRAAAPSAWAPA
ncbi:elongation factor P maturation arginine rhamnosyltransferase EarP [Ramlibacter sp. MAHUQ-53]|uniref:elongation factor P maturation arginine rhamnosyltransferase EarP n=1 Tax=unclassified Ramlibacter TaxID=2617605 RepID=UPI003631F19A